MTSTITVCDTCKRADYDPERDGAPHGAAFASLIEAAADGVAEVQVRRHSCLMGCDFACNVSIQGAGKIAYTLGTFTPGADVAAAVVEYARLHASSETGQVPYRTWPAEIKGHFRARLYPLEP